MSTELRRSLVMFYPQYQWSGGGKSCFVFVGNNMGATGQKNGTETRKYEARKCLFNMQEITAHLHADEFKPDKGQKINKLL